MKIPYNGNRHSGLRFARSSREAFGSSISFDEEARKPDRIVGWTCAASFVIFAYLVATGMA